MDPWSSAAIYAALVVGLGFSMLALTLLLGPRRPNAAKSDPYECGIPPLSESRERFSVHFYLVAILFILFDIETVFMIPYAILYEELRVAGLVTVGIFVGVLTFGLVYLWKRGALEWD
jgi:NADH-quinone oxidoreductase subunit A